MLRKHRLGWKEAFPSWLVHILLFIWDEEVFIFFVSWTKASLWTHRPAPNTDSSILSFVFTWSPWPDLYLKLKTMQCGLKFKAQDGLEESCIPKKVRDLPQELRQVCWSQTWCQPMWTHLWFYDMWWKGNSCFGEKLINIFFSLPHLWANPFMSPLSH